VPDELVHFNVDETISPSKNSYYSVLTAFRKQARDRLHEMEKSVIIEAVTKACHWYQKGKTDYRLVVNMKGPYREIKRSFHRLPTIEEMRATLGKATVFTKLDLKSAFHHLKLDEESRELTTFQTEMRFTRLVLA
jgi:hypothetical protein